MLPTRLFVAYRLHGRMRVIGSGSLADPVPTIAFFSKQLPSNIVMIGIRSLVGAVVGACIGTALLYTVILMVLIL